MSEFPPRIPRAWAVWTNDLDAGSFLGAALEGQGQARQTKEKEERRRAECWQVEEGGAKQPLGWEADLDCRGKGAQVARREEEERQTETEGSTQTQKACHRWSDTLT